MLTFHLWKIDEVFSSADGKAQAIELHDPAAGENHLAGHFISSNEHSFTFPTDLPSADTANHHFLIGTTSYAALPGAVTPDYVVPDNFFNPAGDSLDYADVDAFTFTSSQMPTDGTNALLRDVNTGGLSTGANSETNLAGQTGLVSAAGSSASGYLQVNLVADQPGAALIDDPNLVNPWGVALPGTGGALWVSDNGADVSTLYSGDVAGSPFGKVPLTISVPGGEPTGQVVGTNSFTVSAGGASGPARFIFASESGNITAWSPSVPAAGSTQAETGWTTPNAVYKGLALANNGTADQLYAANFNSGAIDVFDSAFQPVSLAAGAFTDPNLPAGYAPFNIQNLGGKLYVTYALQDADKHDDVAGFGHGFVDVYDTSGTLLQRLISGQPGNASSPLNSPWGLAIAPSNFGDLSGDLLVGNFGNGKINAFDPATGAFLGTLTNAAGSPIVIDGLWALQFGNGNSAGDANTLFFTAGSDGEQHGLLGAIVSAASTPLSGDGGKITATEGASFSGTVAAFTSSEGNATAGSFTANIDWGDGTSSAGTIVSNGDGGFNVSGAHTYSQEGAETLHVVVADQASHSITLNASATVKDAPLAASGVPVNLGQGLTLSSVSVATFTDAGGAEPAANYSATIDWGDGTTSAGSITPTITAGTFGVTGGHTYAADGREQISVSTHDAGGSSASVTTSAQAGYLQVNLVADQPGAALVEDPNLVNPWGVALPGTGGALWVSDNGADVSTLYSGDVAGSAFGKVPLTISVPGGAPTGQVVGTNSFTVSAGGASGPARFIFASESGNITAWSPSVPAAGSTQAETGWTTPNAVYKGLALANNGTADQLYAANFNSGAIDVFDSAFQPVSLGAGAFTDPNLPAGYAPFNIQNLGGKLYVTYALQDADKHDDVAGFGHGFVDVYDTSGTLLQRLISGQPGNSASPLNSPWGLAIAPSNFGDLSGDLLVGNFGNGKINAFDPATGAFLGTLTNAAGSPIVIDGLWALQFGNGNSAGDTNTLFFTAGSDGEQHGLLGAIVSAASTPLSGDGGKLTATEGASFSGTVAAFTSSDAAATAASFTTNISWGDGTSSAGTIVSNGDGGFNVSGAHTYSQEGAETLHVVVADQASHSVTLNASATVKDAPLSATGVPVNLGQGLTLSSVSVATFTDAGGAEPAANYSATIDWGDGTTSAGSITPTTTAGAFGVTGSHTYAADGREQISVSIHDAGGSSASVTTSAQAGYLQVNLVADQPGAALIDDPNLVNPWGIALSPTNGAFWIADNGSDVATLYTGDVAGSPFAKSSLTVSIPGGAPTGQVFNSTSDFVVSNGTASGPALFIFSSEDGDITGWNPSVPPPPPSTHAQTGHSTPGAVYKGLALASNNGANFLYATNFASGAIDVFDHAFQPVTLASGVFTDPNLPAGFAPFGIANIGDKLYVTYAKQDAAKHDDVAGFGNGFVDVFDPAGNLLQRLVTGQPGNPASPLNSPWGLALAPSNFGDFSGDLLVGNFGNGAINAFDPTTGAFHGAITDAGGTPIKIDGLWALQFGNGNSAGDANTLFFTAGSDDEQHGLFGALVSAANTPLAGEGTHLTATEGATLSGTVATFASSDTTVQPSGLAAIINWGDGTSSAGSIAANGDGGFNVSGSHKFSEEGTQAVAVTITDANDDFLTVSTTIVVADAPLTATAVPVSPTQGITVSNAITATFTDAGGPEPTANYTASIDWGDGTTTTGSIAAAANSFSVVGSHTYATTGAHAIKTTITDDGDQSATVTSSTAIGYLQENLVSDQAGLALIQDPSLVNPWGIALPPTSGAFWIADNGSDVATLYTGDVAGSPFAKSSLTVSIPGGTPTGQVFNSTSDFVVSNGTASGPALFIFSSEDGDITGWNPSVPPPPPSTHAQTGHSTPGAVYKGLALASNNGANFLYATNFASGAIDVFDHAFQPVTLASGSFTDPNLPAGFAPFGIANIGGKLYVTYAKQDADKHDDVAGFGNGFVDVFDPAGNLLQRLVTSQPGNPASPLNSPWGLALAPSNFGDFGGDLLVGNFGNGAINAFDPTTGAFLGALTDAGGTPIKIDGLWALQFGNGASAGDANTLFFTAGSDDEQHGLFGALVSAVNTPLAGEGTHLTATEGSSFSGAVATFSTSDTAVQLGSLTATIDWGDGTSSAGSIASNGGGGFIVSGTHLFTEEGTDNLKAIVHDGAGHTITINGATAVADAPLAATGVQVKADGQSTAPILVATFTDPGGDEPIANYSATIDWGDGTSTSAGTITASGGAFDVTGSHAFTKPGRHTIAVSIKDEGGATAQATSHVVAGSDHQRVIEELFEALLGRDVDDDGLSHFAGLLDQGTSAAAIAEQIEQAVEFRQHEVQGLYQLLLRRPAERSGQSYFVDILAHGTTQQAETIIASSPEYFQVRGGSNATGFLTSLFQDALHRGPDAQALATLGNQPLDDPAARARLAATVFSSDEFLTQLLDQPGRSNSPANPLLGGLYESLLGRPADPAGLTGFLAELKNGTPLDQVLAAIVGSPEFAARA